jgi:hypothetical protein
VCLGDCITEGEHEPYVDGPQPGQTEPG